MTTTTPQVTESDLAELVRRIVDAVHPLRIILFGSAARGEMTADSDVDVVVEMPEGTEKLPTGMYLHRQMIGSGLAVDFVVLTKGELERYGHVPGMIYRQVLREGKTIYAA
jgi:predicted nucleotidyltransferase